MKIHPHRHLRSHCRSGFLAHGAVEDWARAVLEIGAGLLFLVWAVANLSQARESTGHFAFAFAAGGGLLLIAFVQLVFHSTASSYGTRMELQLLLADILVLFLAAQAFRTLEDWRGFVWFGMSFGFVVALFGILQHLTFNGKLYWFREMHFGGIPFGPYVNRNHFAGFAELIIPISLVPLVLGEGAPGTLVSCQSLCRRSDRCAVSFCIRGGVVSFGVELGVVDPLVASPPYRRETPALRRRSPFARISYGVLAGCTAARRTVFFLAIT